MAEHRDIREVEKRVDDLREWLKQNAPEVFTEQKHLDDGTRERAYWHYGYMVALRDVLRFLTGDHLPTEHSHEDRPSSSHAA